MDDVDAFREVCSGSLGGVGKITRSIVVEMIIAT